MVRAFFRLPAGLGATLSQESIALPLDNRQRPQQALDQALERLFTRGKRITEVRLPRHAADRIGIPVKGSMYKDLRLVAVTDGDRAVLTYED